jgi:hypothetical protein
MSIFNTIDSTFFLEPWGWIHEAPERTDYWHRARKRPVACRDSSGWAGSNHQNSIQPTTKTLIAWGCSELSKWYTWVISTDHILSFYVFLSLSLPYFCPSSPIRVTSHFLSIFGLFAIILPAYLQPPGELASGSLRTIHLQELDLRVEFPGMCWAQYSAITTPPTCLGNLASLSVE